MEGFAKAAEESMNTATEEERSLAIQCNDVINGIPHISVIGDGSWMKRSYRTGRYDSLSGVGTVYSVRAGKVLHMYGINIVQFVYKQKKRTQQCENINIIKIGEDIAARRVWRQMRLWKDSRRAYRNADSSILHL